MTDENTKPPEKSSVDLVLSSARNRFTMDFKFAGADKLTRNRNFHTIALIRMKEIIEYFMSDGTKEPYPKIAAMLALTGPQAKHLMNDEAMREVIKEAGRKAMQEKLAELRTDFGSDPASADDPPDCHPT